jgi:hypothetical protein
MGKPYQTLSLMSLRRADFQLFKVVRHCDLKPLESWARQYQKNNRIATTNLKL